MANQRIRRWRTPVVLLVGWIVVVIVGAGRKPDKAPLLGVEHIGDVLAVAMVLLAVLGLIFIIFLTPTRSGGFIEPEKNARSIWVLLAIIALLLIWRPDIFGAVQELAVGDEAVEETDAAGPELVESEPPAESVAQATDVLLLLAGIGVIGGVWIYLRSRSAELDPVVETAVVDTKLEAELLDAMSDASAELASSEDPRTNVLNAYASLERVLASQQHRRRAAETPSEHLARALSSLRVDPQPLVALGGLYELARFAEVEITTAQQDQARDALDRARQQLAALA